MPNSGFPGQINQCFHGTRKGDLVPLRNNYVSGNLPNPAFWKRFIQESGTGTESANPRVLTTLEVLAPVRPSNMYSREYTRHSNRSAAHSLPRITASPTRGSNEGPYHAPALTFVVPPISRGHARDAHIPLIALNSIAPFATSCKPTCGYFFSRSTDNKKKCIGIPATDLVKYRYYVK